MTTRRLWAALSVMLLSASTAAAADLTKVDRTVVREPAYQSKPKYCLLVFGPEARTRVWIVQDGATLYVDRNGNGDLTEAGEKVAAKANRRTVPEEGVYDFEAGEIADGAFVHKGLRCSIFKIDHLADDDERVKALLANDPKARGFMVDCDLEIPGLKGAGIGGRVEQGTTNRDLQGPLQFADRPKDAPVIHFGGPLQIGLLELPKLVIGRKKEVIVTVGTPGVGPGTTAVVSFDELIPKDVYPRVEAFFPPEGEGSVPYRELYELKERC
jgi:hypothetical protein